MESYAFMAVVLIVVGMLGLCAFAIAEALRLLRERKRQKLTAEAESAQAETLQAQTEPPPAIDAEAAEKKLIRETVQNFAAGLFPPGCKLYHENGRLSLGGELLAAIMVEDLSRGPISPCNGCAYRPECEAEGRFQPRTDRLNTDNLKVRPFTRKEMEYILPIMMGPADDTVDWAFDPDNELDPDEKMSIPWIMRMIRKRIVGERLKIEITKKAYFLLLVITEGNPGKAMFVLHKIGNLFEKRGAQRWLVTSSVINSSLFPLGVPTEESFAAWWDSQKTPRDSGKSWSDNLVDMFPDEWRKKEKAALKV